MLHNNSTDRHQIQHQQDVCTLNNKMEDIRIFAVYLSQKGLLCRLLAAYLTPEDK